MASGKKKSRDSKDKKDSNSSAKGGPPPNLNQVSPEPPPVDPSSLPEAKASIMSVSANAKPSIMSAKQSVHSTSAPSPHPSIMHSKHDPSMHAKIKSMSDGTGRHRRSLESVMSSRSARSTKHSIASVDYVARSKMSRLSEIILGGPRNVGSLIVRWRKHLTYKPDRTYFTGRAGVIRMITLFIVVASTCCGLPGFTETDHLHTGYGEVWNIKLSIAIMTCVATIQSTFILLLLSYREVRCQSKWDDWNSQWHALCSLLSCIAGLMELIGIFQTRALNCQENAHIVCITVEEKYNAIVSTANLAMPFKFWHYAACIGKFLAGLLFSLSSRIWLKNDILADYM